MFTSISLLKLLVDLFVWKATLTLMEFLLLLSDTNELGNLWGCHVQKVWCGLIHFQPLGLECD